MLPRSVYVEWYLVNEASAAVFVKAGSEVVVFVGGHTSCFLTFPFARKARIASDEVSRLAAESLPSNDAGLIGSLQCGQFILVRNIVLDN